MSGTDLVIKDKNFNERIQYNPVIGKSKERVDKCMNKIKEEIDKLEKEFSGNGRVLIRPSGTEPLVRVMIEGENQGYIKAKAEALAKLIEQKLK